MKDWEFIYNYLMFRFCELVSDI